MFWAVLESLLTCTRLRVPKSGRRSVRTRSRRGAPKAIGRTVPPGVDRPVAATVKSARPPG